MAVINGTEIDLMPTAGMREEAQRYRDWKAEGEGGGTEVARRRATQILSGNEEDIIKNKDTWVFEKPVSSTGPAWILIST